MPEHRTGRAQKLTPLLPPQICFREYRAFRMCLFDNIMLNTNQNHLVTLVHSMYTAPQNSPRTWLLTSSLSPLHIFLIRSLLSHGDRVVACLSPKDIDDPIRTAEFRDMVSETGYIIGSTRPACIGDNDLSGGRLRGVRCDARMASECEAAVAQCISLFGRLDVLLCCKTESEQPSSYICYQPIVFTS